MIVLHGVSGRVGSVAAKQLLAQGKKVRVLVRDEAKAGDWKKNADVVQVALDDTAGLTRALTGAEAFYTLLPSDYAGSGFRATQKRLGASITKAVVDSKVPHVVLLSSIGADFDGPSGPILGLHWLENDLRASGTALTAVRPGYFQENVLMVAQVAKDQGVYPAFYPQGFAMPMIATPDIGKEVARSLASTANGHTVIDVVGPGYTAEAVAAAFGKIFNRTVSVAYVPPEAQSGALVQAGLPKEVADLFAEMYTFFREGKAGLQGDRLVQGTTTLEETLRAHLV
jgi:uncharacterized protein YbjT (DUF2867 family)